MVETRKLVAILAADVVGFSRLASADEDRTLARLRTLRSDLIDPTIAVHHGRVVKRTGNGSIIEFRSVVDAVRCAIEVQNGMVERNAGLPPERRIEFRVGIHLGDVVEESDGDLMGDGVNLAKIKFPRRSTSMKRRHFLRASFALAAASALRVPPARGASVSRVRPGMPGWPAEADWAALSQATNGRLLPVTLPKLDEPEARKLQIRSILVTRGV
jgi:adenylate cyclase